MFFIVDGQQIVYPEIEALTNTCREMGGKVALVFLQMPEPHSEEILKARQANHAVDMVSVIAEDTLECRCKLYKFLIQEAASDPENTTIISNKGDDLAAAILIGCDFSFAMDFA